MKDIFENVKMDDILSFFREIKLYKIINAKMINIIHNYKKNI